MQNRKNFIEKHENTYRDIEIIKSNKTMQKHFGYKINEVIT